MKRLAPIPIFLVLFSSGVVAQSVVQEAYLKASNTGEGDEFGTAVAISGQFAVVGAPNEDSADRAINGNQGNDDANEAGAAYVFARNGDSWGQEAYLKASNAEAGDLFGNAVAISGNTIVVGAPTEDSAATTVNGNEADNTAMNGGAAYVFVRGPGGWTQQAYLKAPDSDPNDRFGWAVAISGDTIVVGAPFHEPPDPQIGFNRFQDAGAIYVFTRDGVTWSQETRLSASNRGADDRFGSAVDISGGTIVVGAPMEDSLAAGVNGNESDNGALASGAAYVYERERLLGFWMPKAYLKASNTDSGDGFGGSVAVSDDTVVVGARGEDSKSNGVNGDQLDNAPSGNSGAAYVFARNRILWTQQAYLKAFGNTAPIDGFFGSAVDVFGNTIIVGRPGPQGQNQGTDGEAFTFVRMGGVWSEEALLAPGAESPERENFGESVSIAGELVLGGAPHESSATTGVNEERTVVPAVFSGAAYVHVLPRPDIAVHDGALPSDPEIGAGQSDTVSITPILVGTPVSRDFTIVNHGPVDLNVSAITMPNGFSVLNAPAGPIPTDGTHTIKIELDTSTAAERTGTVVIVSDDPDESVFSFPIAGHTVAPGDTDGDGMDNYPEVLLASLGFDPDVANPKLVSDYYTHSHAAGLFRLDQLPAVQVETPLIFHDPATGKFTLTLGLKKSTDLQLFSPFPFVAEDLTVNPSGNLEFEFTDPDPTAVFRVEAN